MNTRIESSNKIFYRILSFLVVFAVLLYGFPQIANAAGGSYSISFYASDPSVNKGPYSPTYDKLTPHVQPPYTDGRGDNVLEHAVLYAPGAQSNDRDGVTSLEPADLALGQIVVFQVEISATGSTDSENGRIKFSAGWNTKSTSGSDFGFDPDYGVYSAFVDYGDPGSIDPDENATVEDYSYVIANEGTSNEEIQGNFVIAGLDQGDRVIVEIWIVLKDSLPDNPTGNVQARMISANTLPEDGSPQTINVGNRTIPLKQLGSFTSIKTDIAITKSDDPDPVYAGDELTYTISVTNKSDQYVANGIIVEDELDSRLTFISADNGGTLSGNTVTWPMMALAPLETAVLKLVVHVPFSITDIWPGTDADDRGTAATTAITPAPDLLNKVTVTSTISDDPNTDNNFWQEPTNVLLRTTDITVTKSWDDSYDNQEDYFGLRPESIQAQLQRNGQTYGDVFEIKASEGWEKTFTGLLLRDSSGSPYTYTAVEVNPHNSYLVSSDGLEIENALRRVDKEAEKIWEDFDNEFGYRPDSIRVKLLRDGTATGMEADLTSANYWKHTFTGLPEKAADGHTYIYSVEEISETDRYAKSEVGMTVTNTLETGEITVNKLAGASTDLTDQTFYVKLTKADDTTKSWVQAFAIDDLAVFENLPYGTYNVEEVADIDGTPLTSLFIYNVNVKDDSLTISDTNTEASTDITNTVKTGSISISKQAAPGTAISGVTFYVELSSIDDPTKSWVQSFMTGEGNEAIFSGLSLGDYTFEEVADAQGTALDDTFKYNAIVSDEKLEITPQALNASGSVTNQIKTGTVTANKLAGENTELGTEELFYAILKSTTTSYQEIKSMTISSPAVFTQVPLGSYTVEEVADSLGTALPDNYRYDVTVSDESITVAPEALEASSDITNTLRRTEISGQKIWQDQDDNFGLRPDSITVYLYQNDDSEPIASMPVTAADADENDNNIWSFTFPDLPMFDENNEAYTYSVSEPFVSPDYEEPDIDGMDITNTLITAGIQLLKLSSGPETIPLADASFELWRALPQNEEQLLSFDTDLIPGTLIPGMRLETITTGEDGIAETEGKYPQGMYYLMETAAPFGYYPLTEPTQINLTSETIIQLEGAPFELTIHNDFIYEPDLTILKTVANLTAGTAQSESAELLAGETANYEVTVTNSGNATLDEVLLYDSEAYEGLIAVDQDGIEYTFANDSEDNAYILLGAMEPLQEFILNYEYVTVEADAEISPIINTATAEGIILPPQIDIASDQFYNPFPEGWFKSVSDSAEITVTLPPEETTTETTPEETTTETAPTIPLITVITETIPLAEPAITSPSMPTIQITEEEIPLATPETITLVTEEIPKSGENPPIWPIGLAMIIIAGGIALLIHKQDGDKTKYEDDL